MTKLPSSMKIFHLDIRVRLYKHARSFDSFHPKQSRLAVFYCLAICDPRSQNYLSICATVVIHSSPPQMHIIISLPFRIQTPASPLSYRKSSVHLCRDYASNVLHVVYQLLCRWLKQFIVPILLVTYSSVRLELGLHWTYFSSFLALSTPENMWSTVKQCS